MLFLDSGTTVISFVFLNASLHIECLSLHQCKLEGNHCSQHYIRYILRGGYFHLLRVSKHKSCYVHSRTEVDCSPKAEHLTPFQP